MIEYFSYLFIGFVVGFFAGMFGGGTGIFCVPALLFMFTHFTNIPSINSMHFSIGTAISISTICFLGALYREIKYSNYKPPVLFFWLVSISGVITIPPAIFIAAHSSSQQLKLIFAIVLILTALTLYLPKASTREQRILKNPILFFIIAGITNLLGTITGAGAGAFVLPLLKRIGLAVQECVALLIRAGAFILPFMTLGYFIIGYLHGFHNKLEWGYIYLPATLIIGFISLIVSFYSVKLRQLIPERWLKLAFFILLLLLSCFMLLHTKM